MGTINTSRFRPQNVVLAAALLVGLMPPVLAAAGEDQHAADPLDRYNVVWDSPSTGSSGSMPLGNGDTGLNLWVEEDGDLLFYLSKTDAWSGIGRLLKLGRVRVKLSPNPFAAGLPFRQTLKLRQGRIEICAGPDDSQTTVNVRVDANRPVVYVEVEGAQKSDVHVALEIWRKEARTITDGTELHSVRGLSGGPIPIVVEPDTVPDRHDNRITWYHRNESSIWPAVLEDQALGSVMPEGGDPLLHRTFGGIIEGEGLVRAGPTSLASAEPKTRHRIAVHVLTRQTETPEAWLAEIDRQLEQVRAADPGQGRAAHDRWWNDFWNRSWIRITQSEEVFPTGYRAVRLVRNTLPLRIGADSAAANRFAGDLDRALVYGRALEPEEIAEHASGKMPPPGAAPGCVADWTFDNLGEGAFASRAPGELSAAVVGDVEVIEVVDCADGRSGKALRLDGRGYLEVAHDRTLDLQDAVTLEARIRPKKTAGRILDKTKAATATGYMLDTHPGNSLRLVVQDGNLDSEAQLAVDRWVHVAGVFDARTGRKELYVDGVRVASGETARAGADPRERDPTYIVSRGYALQRFISACGGRGAYPIKFNGSIFTVDAQEKGKQLDADYRRWGGCYWFQNTRLAYWPMLASGDFDLMQPLFRMYLAALPLATDRVRLYYDHAGAFFPETMYFWATPAGCDYGWNRGDMPDGFVQNSYIRYYWQGGLELTTMMLDRWAYTEDRTFLESTLLPLAVPILEFYDRHYPRDDQGKIRFEPAASLETWHVAVNPLPEIVGLGFVLEKMLELPADAVTEQQRETWKRLLGELPPLPAGQDDGHTYLLPAREYSRRANSENPELYAVFPYRRFGLGKPDLEVGRLTFERRMVKRTGGWTQDPIQAAFLGLTEVARDYTVRNFSTSHGGSRFPAFWGPNFDWIPDQDHGSVSLVALQTMLLQADDRRILLLPAWPKDWNCEFKLHAPLNTTLEGTYRDGKLERLTVTPEERAGDVRVVSG